MTAPKMERLTVEVNSTLEALLSRSQSVEHLRAVIRALSGNILELESAIERAVLLRPGDAIDNGMPPSAATAPVESAAMETAGQEEAGGYEDTADDEVATIGFQSAALQLVAAKMANGHTAADGRWLTAAEVEREHIVRTLELTHDNQSNAAKLLDIDRHQLRRRMRMVS